MIRRSPDARDGFVKLTDNVNLSFGWDAYKTVTSWDLMVIDTRRVHSTSGSSSRQWTNKLRSEQCWCGYHNLCPFPHFKRESLARSVGSDEGACRVLEALMGFDPGLVVDPFKSLDSGEAGPLQWQFCQKTIANGVPLAVGHAMKLAVETGLQRAAAS